MASRGDNTLGRLNEVLFAELERLNDVDVTDSAAGRPRKSDLSHTDTKVVDQ